MTIVVLTALFFSASMPAGLSPPRDDATYLFASGPDGKALHALDSIGGYFTENRGQVHGAVRYYSRGNPAVAFRDDGVMFVVTEADKGGYGEAWPEQTDRFTAVETATTKSFAYMLRFEGASRVVPVGIDRLSFDSNFFFGNDPSNWRTSVPNFMEVAYRNLYDGIDLVYRQGENGVKYEFHVSPGANPAQIEMAYEGIDRLRLDSDGGIIASTTVGDVRDLVPVSYQGEDEIKCPFSLRGPASFGFACRGRDASRALVIDPLVYSTFLGGSDMEIPWHIATDPSGSAHIVGFTRSPDFPVTPGAFDVSFNWGAEDGFVAKLNPDGGSLAWATFLGGFDVEWASDVAVDSLGDVYVVGSTRSTDFPVTMGAFDTSFNGLQDAFVARFTRDGVLIWATYLGGADSDQGHAVALDSSGNVVVASMTYSPDFPVTPGAFDTTFNGIEDVYVAKLNPAGNLLLWATFLGGNDDDQIFRITLGADDIVYASGTTWSIDFPVTPGAFDTTYNGGGADAFIAKLDSTGSALVWATYLGGSNQDVGVALVLDGSGNLYVTGGTNSTDFPVTPGAFDTTLGGPWDIFIAKLNSTGSNLLWATYFGGSDSEAGSPSAVLNVAGDICVTGATYSTDFPATPGAFDTTLDGIFDGFLARLNPDGTGLLYATFIGGSGGDDVRDMVLDTSGYAYFTGYTGSADFPVTPGAFDTTYNDAGDAFVAKFGPVGPPNTPPVLAWTGETNYVSDGLDPETGTTFTDFTYRVAYYDADNNSPAQIYVRIEKPLGTPYGTFPLSFDAWKGIPNNYTTGAIYTFSTSLFAGTNYWYYFRATDGWEWASGPPTVPIDAPDVIADNPPVAVANAFPTSAFIGDTITFDATASTDDFGITAYLWDFGDTATDTNPLTTHSYTSRGTFLATLTVWDTACQNDTDTVSISIGNRQPAADAGPDQSVNKSDLVTLNGTGSNDPDGDPLTYLWNQTGGPTVILAGADTATPTFSSAISGIYTFILAVEDGWGGSSNDTVNVAIVNRAPVAEAGPDQTVRKKTTVTLDGTGSSDPDGDTLMFAWIQTGGPTVVLSGADTASPTFTPPRSGLYTFQLTVNDGDGGVSSDTVGVTATNANPVADAGPDQTVSKKTLVTLDGGGSSDPDGDPLTYAWTQAGGPIVILAGAGTATPTFTPPRSGTYTFQLTVDDGDGGVSSDTVVVTATNQPPTAEAGPNQTAWKNTPVTLEGSLSSDPNGDMLTFSWTQVSGNSVTLTGADTATPSFTPTKTGTYTFNLHVDDGDGGTSDDTVTVIVWGLPPTAHLVATPQSAQVGVQIEFDASGSTDPDGTIVDFAFSFGDNTSASGITEVRNHSYAAPGTYTVTLTVTDDDGNTSTAQVTVEIIAPPPPPSVEANYKPVVAVIFAIILLVAGAWSSKRRPWKGRKDGTAVAKAFALVSMPFILAEVATGAVSFLTGQLSMPPAVGMGTAVDLAILLAGLAVAMLRALRKTGTEPEGHSMVHSDP
jgi:PKD repeat protein